METTSAPTPETDDNGRRRWLRRTVLGVACLPLAVIGVLHKMGRSDDFGVLGEWYVMVPLTVAGVFAWLLMEKAVHRLAR
ncbi:hypothetical protein [Paractinoplanes maris]|uniref:hypothetical protein n=1 Tax=Paractinoplanes maris TaxID=1734446 RepID=UPI002020DD5D|nr:hypothetical protein [Actinoplanes maris]